MADKDGIVVSEVIKQRDKVASQMREVICGHVSRPCRIAIPTLVRHDDVIASGRKRWQLIPPAKGMRRPTVTKYDRVSKVFFSGFKNFQFNTVYHT